MAPGVFNFEHKLDPAEPSTHRHPMDRFYMAIDLKCPSCGRTGAGEGSEADNLFSNEDFMVESVPMGFSVVRARP
jgi:hypothetical protein